MHAQQAELVGIVASLSVADTERAAQVWRQRAEALVELPEPVEAGSGVVDGPHWRWVGRPVRARPGRGVDFEQAIRIASSLG